MLFVITCQEKKGRHSFQPMSENRQYPGPRSMMLPSIALIFSSQSSIALILVG